MVPCKSTAEEVSFEWSNYRISSTDSKVRTTLHVSIIDSGTEKVDIKRYTAENFIHQVDKWCLMVSISGNFAEKIYGSNLISPRY